eukprot:15449834-Alexandrium_andersonii.AAC.1
MITQSSRTSRVTLQPQTPLRRLPSPLSFSETPGHVFAPAHAYAQAKRKGQVARAQPPEHEWPA